MGYKHYVYGWTFGKQHGIPTEPDTWYYKELFGGQSLLAALWTALRARRHYGCVKVELR